MNIVDLSLPLYDGMPVYEGDPAVHITRVRTRERDGWELRLLQMGSHTGTHVDAPAHMHAQGATLDELPLSAFCGPATVVSPHYTSFPSGVGLLFHEPVTAAALPRLLAARPPFVGGPLAEDVECGLLRAGIVTYTDLDGVEKLQGKRFTFYGLPLRVRGGDGSPVRAVAVLDE